MEVPRQKHQTQPIYTAPRLSDRFDRVSPLNNRRSIADNFHDNKTTSIQSQISGRQTSKNVRRHSTNTYNTTSPNQKELSPANSQSQQSNSSR